jgi:hypothetical protein
MGLKLCAKIVRTLLVSKMMVMVSILLDNKNYNHIFAILEYDDSNLPASYKDTAVGDLGMGPGLDNDLIPEFPNLDLKDGAEFKPLNSYRDFCENSLHILMPMMDDPTINFIKMRFRFVFLKDYIFAICSEELLGLLHYRLVILNTTILECLLKGVSIKLLIENSFENQETFSNFLTEMLQLIKLSSSNILCNFPQYILEHNLLDAIIKNIQLVLRIDCDLTTGQENTISDGNLTAGDTIGEKPFLKDELMDNEVTNLLDAQKDPAYED